MNYGNWSSRMWLTTLAGIFAAAMVINANAVELANIDATGGGTDTNSLSIPTGQSTANFFVEPPTGAGAYPIRIGDSRTDDYANGVLLGSAREFGGRTDTLGTAYWPIISAGSNSQGATAPDGTLNIFVRQRIGATTNQLGNSDVAAAYFPFSEGWIGATTRNNSNGGSPNATSSLNGVDLTDLLLGFGAIANGVSRVPIPGVTDTRQQGLLFVNHAKNEDNHGVVAPSPTGDAFILGTQNGGNAMANEPDPYAFVYIPYGTPNITMASIHGASGPNQQPTVLNSSGSPFTISRTDVGTYRLSIPGQSPTSGVLLTNVGGRINSGGTSTFNDVLTYDADGNDWVLQLRDWGSGTPTLVDPALATPNADRSQAFQFAFMPFATPPTAPGPNPAPLNLKDKVLGYHVQLTEVDGTANENPGMYGVVANGTSGYRLEHLRQNRGDNSVAINGFFPSDADGVYFASVNQGFRDNSTTGGEAAYGMIAAGDGGGGWEFATHIADPGLGTSSSVEFNVNFGAVFFGADTPFQKANNVLQPVDPNPPGLTVSLPGVNTLTSGVLVAQAWGNNDDFAVATPAADGSNWTINTYDNNTGQSRNEVNWIYLPYSAQNLVAGRVDATGTVLASTNPSGFTLAKQGDGTYLLTIAGKTPSMGTLLLTPERTNDVEDNVLVYEASGNSFRIFGIDQVSFEEKTALTFPSLEDTSFTFAFIDHNAPPVLAPSFADADFNQDGSVNSADYAAWRGGFGTAAGATKAQGDSNGDGDVDGSDFLKWQEQFGLPGVTANGAPVPEPGAVALVLSTLACLAARGRKRS